MLQNTYHHPASSAANALTALSYIPDEPLFLDELTPAKLDHALQEALTQADANQLIPSAQVKRRLTILTNEI